MVLEVTLPSIDFLCLLGWLKASTVAGFIDRTLMCVCGVVLYYLTCIVCIYIYIRDFSKKKSGGRGGGGANYHPCRPLGKKHVY